MFSRVLPRWSRGYVTIGQNLRDLDENTANALDLTGGGSFAPSAPINIAGEHGLVVATKSLMSLGAGVVLAAEKHLIFEKDSESPGIRYGAGHTARSRALLRVVNEGWSSSSEGAIGFYTVSGTLQSQSPGTRFFIPLRVFDRGTLASVTFRWRVGSAHGGVPQYLPRFRVIRSDGRIAEPLRSADSTTDQNGWLEWNPRPSSGSNYYNSGAIKALAYACDQKNVVDRSKYFYLGEIEDERGTNAFSGASNTGNVFTSTLCDHTDIDRLLLRQ